MYTLPMRLAAFIVLCFFGVFVVVVFLFFVFSRATPAAYGGSLARGLIGAVAAGLRQSHSNAGSEPCWELPNHILQ